MCHTEILNGYKMVILDEKLNIYLFIAQNIDYGYTLERPQ